MKYWILERLNWILQRGGLEIVPCWHRHWWSFEREFTCWNQKYVHFYHSYNCGWPPYTTERTVELALADAWLEGRDCRRVVEIGAVTPYYWPNRVMKVIDPFDPHPLVSQRCSLFDIDLRGRDVLSISTFEHIGTTDYGSGEKPNKVIAALDKLLSEGESFLVTAPLGYNRLLDQHLLNSRHLACRCQPDLSCSPGTVKLVRDTATRCSRPGLRQ